MNETTRIKRFELLPLLLSAVLILGMIIGVRLANTLRNKRSMITVAERKDRIEEIIDLIEAKYVDTIDRAALYEDAVRGILTHLDPHTVYIPAADVADVNAQLEGSFYGIGVEYDIIRDTILVTSVLENGPADKAGVVQGDRMISVDDTVIAGNGITSEKISKLLRGKQFSTVKVRLKDGVRGGIRNVLIHRDQVPLYSVEASVMINDTTGYIKINRFAENTYEEFRDALETLVSSGMKSLIIDLRENPGGYLDEAVEILDELIDDKKLLLYTQGLRSQRNEYKAGREGLFEQGNLAVLIDERAASASEILAGAIQDWDRGIIVGRRSFGKGLVQEQYELGDGAALRLTVARYYTPSGRSIQRSYREGKEAYGAAFYARVRNAADSVRQPLNADDTQKYFTNGGRVVYGGGGIFPDVYVAFDSSRNTALMQLYMYDNLLNEAVWDYYAANVDSLKEYRTVRDFNQRFNEADSVIIAYIKQRPIEQQSSYAFLFDSAALHQALQETIKARLGRIQFRNEGYYSVVTHHDAAIRAAMSAFSKPLLKTADTIKR